MNQRADSRKKNLGVIVAKPLINERRWLLSHTVRCNRGENGIEKAFDRVIARFSACWHRIQRILPVRAFAFRETTGLARTNRVQIAARPQGGTPAPRSGLPGLGGFLGLARLGADRFSRTCRLDAERPSRRDRGFRLGFEERPASRRELRFVPDHAGCDALDIRNLRAAKPKRVRAAGLLLLVGVGSACRRPHQNRERGCEHQTELEIPGPDSKHESPRSVAFAKCG
jgi:hypothetical protein